METYKYLKRSRWVRSLEVVSLEDGTAYVIPVGTCIVRMERGDGHWLDLLALPGGEKVSLRGNGGSATLSRGIKPLMEASQFLIG